MAFDLSNYETVDERLHKWWKEYADGRIETELFEASATRFIVIARIYKTQTENKPCATGLAMEIISDRGVNANFALPNAETSAIGRALANAGFSAKGKRPSREEMAAVNEKEKIVYGRSNNRSAVVESALRSQFAQDREQAQDPTLVSWSIGDVVDVVSSQAPKPKECDYGGEMILKEGVAKSGKPYYGYVCNCGKPKDKQCPAQWAKVTAAGNWYFEGDN